MARTISFRKLREHSACLDGRRDWRQAAGTDKSVVPTPEILSRLTMEHIKWGARHLDYYGYLSLYRKHQERLADADHAYIFTDTPISLVEYRVLVTASTNTLRQACIDIIMNWVTEGEAKA